MKTINTTTKSGLDVKLTSALSYGVRAELMHPEVGKIVAIGKWGVLEGRQGIIDNIKINGKNFNICIEIPKKEYDAIIANYKEEEARKDFERREKALAECPEGYVLATQKWSNGDLCSAEYHTEDGIVVLASDLLENHYGFYFLPVKLVNEERKKKQEKELQQKIKQQVEIEKEAALRLQAQKTGEKQLLRKYSVPCLNPVEECNIDIVYEFIMPDGTIKVESCHTW